MLVPEPEEAGGPALPESCFESSTDNNETETPLTDGSDLGWLVFELRTNRQAWRSSSQVLSLCLVGDVSI